MKNKPYMIGDPPIFDPCKKCIIKMLCESACKTKILYEKYSLKKESVDIEVKIKNKNIVTKKRKKRKNENKKRFRYE